LIGYAASSNIVQWASAGIGVAACLGGAYFRRTRRTGAAADDSEGLDEESANWVFARMQSLAAGCD
jgi:hypothetical protein